MRVCAAGSGAESAVYRGGVSEVVEGGARGQRLASVKKAGARNELQVMAALAEQ
jgi:hypothetical protein